MAVKQVVKSRADEAGDVPVRRRILEAEFSAFKCALITRGLPG